MKTIVAIKDSYQGKSVRVFYVVKGAVQKERRLKPLAHIPQDQLPATGSPLPFTSPAFQAAVENLYEEVEVARDLAVDCERLYWNESEEELDARIEANRVELEGRIEAP